MFTAENIVHFELQGAAFPKAPVTHGETMEFLPARGVDKDISFKGDTLIVSPTHKCNAMGYDTRTEKQFSSVQAVPCHSTAAQADSRGCIIGSLP